MTTRRYGPHDPDYAKGLTVTVLQRGRFEVEVPLPASLLRQRAQLNTLAHRGYVPRVEIEHEPLCRTCLLPAAKCLGSRPAVHLADLDDHPFEPAPA